MDDDGRVTQVDIYRPGATPSGAVILAHGFLRSRANMAGHAQALAAEGALAVVPYLPYWSDSRACSPPPRRASSATSVSTRSTGRVAWGWKLRARCGRRR